MPSDRERVAAAGTFYTAAQLAERGRDATVTFAGASRTRIAAQHSGTQRLITVQCKTTRGRAGWPLNEEISPPGEDEWFALVTLHGPGARPDFYIVPRNVAAAHVYVAYRA